MFSVERITAPPRLTSHVPTHTPSPCRLTCKRPLASTHHNPLQMWTTLPEDVLHRIACCDVVSTTYMRGVSRSWTDAAANGAPGRFGADIDQMYIRKLWSLDFLADVGAVSQMVYGYIRNSVDGSRVTTAKLLIPRTGSACVHDWPLLFATALSCKFPALTKLWLRADVQNLNFLTVMMCNLTHLKLEVGDKTVELYPINCLTQLTYLCLEFRKRLMDYGFSSRTPNVAWDDITLPLLRTVGIYVRDSKLDFPNLTLCDCDATLILVVNRVTNFPG